jgi:hypothetical protein
VILKSSQRIILETIRDHDGEWNWYKVGRTCISRIFDPSELTLKPLLDAGLIEERQCADEPLPRLYVTSAGKSALQQIAI